MRKVAFILAMAPAFLGAYEYGPLPGYTGAPGDNPTACISAGCHTGTPNSGPGNVKITLPSGNSGTYVPGQAMQILVQITDSTKSAFGFELTARMGSGNTSQSGDFATTDANTQVVCADGSPKANGKSCSQTFPLEYIEHNLTGYEASTKGGGAYTYAFNWTPPASGSGTVTLYAAANCGPGDPPVSSPTDVYTTKISLTQASAAGPTISGVYDAESARAAITSGQWVAIYGAGLSNTTRFWGDADFTGGTSPGSPLPTKLDGVTVTIGGQPAAVYFVSATQLNVLAPSNLVLGPTQVVVTNNGTSSTAFLGTVVSSSPSFFYYGGGGNLYPLAVHLDGTLVGDPAVQSNSRKAQPGETLEFFANGIAAAQGGVIVAVTQFSQQVSISAGGTALSTSAPFLVSAGEFQVNGTLPSSLASGNYTLSMNVSGGGSTADSGVTVTLPVGP
ncbi:MAG TPA: choice-of-anchor V domain-containing protein [Bryobacteraceae bacterium]|nr:choice-of-anchor V domain-containing protein [Bryobacteraceae bacterium]